MDMIILFSLPPPPPIFFPSKYHLVTLSERPVRVKVDRKPLNHHEKDRYMVVAWYPCCSIKPKEFSSFGFLTCFCGAYGIRPHVILPAHLLAVRAKLEHPLPVFRFQSLSEHDRNFGSE